MSHPLADDPRYQGENHPYTPYQRRQVLEKMVALKEAKDLTDAAEQFTTVEFSDPDEAKKLTQKYDEAPT